MGQKINPIGIRLGITRTWDSRWFAKRADYAKFVLEDVKVRKFIDQQKFRREGISKIEIERKSNNKMRITIHTAKPGVIIGRGGDKVEELKKELETLTGKSVFLNIQEIKQPDIDAKLIAESIAMQLERRVSHRRATKQTISRALRAGAKGIKILCSGRLNGAEIARREWVREGRVPLHTLRAEIDYATDTAITTFGCVGVKVWIFKGEKIGKAHLYGRETTTNSNAPTNNRK
ncbi:MAG TPA: 30S ribosomal protein S3 [Candidatus Riflebacteria bacterium]|jgi:small subunit ribosomal protein S3|nr:ribosomal protein S3 [uncultured bacterium]PKL40953.1 MAG: 30S ribosomal protein S3 [Candidatus Riflebacteria bacterium HGW-Riflebacteria-1]HAE37862.1 30S ribosomal protein S3 [Candidatus Riflebacteria bacterium]